MEQSGFCGGKHRTALTRGVGKMTICLFYRVLTCMKRDWPVLSYSVWAVRPEGIPGIVTLRQALRPYVE